MVAAPAIVRLAENPCETEVAIHLLGGSDDSPSLIVLAPSSWLSRVPYFATKLKELWTPSSEQRHVTLECTHTSSPASYLRCLQLLSTSHPCLPRMFGSVKEVLELLPVADHLLFQECWDACMGFLAATPWSYEEEDDLRATMSILNLKPTDDVQDRLDTSQDLASLEAMLRHMMSSSSMVSSFSALCQERLQSSPPPIKKALHSLLLKMLASYSPTMGSSPSCEWYLLTKILLGYTDGHEIILQMINSQFLFSIVLFPLLGREEDSRYIISQVLQKVLSRVVPLSNSQRAVLVSQCFNASMWHKNPPLNQMRLQRAETLWHKNPPLDSMRLQLAETLPLNHPLRMNLAKNSASCNSAWLDRLFRRVDRWESQQLDALCERRPVSDGNVA